MRKIFKVKNITDVITNSSTEVFMCKTTEETNEILRSFKSLDFTIITNEEEAKKFICEEIENSYGWSDDLICIIDEILGDTEYDTANATEIAQSIIMLHQDLNKPAEEIYYFLKDLFDKLIGYVYMTYNDEGGYMSSQEEAELKQVHQLGIPMIDRH